MATCCGPVCNTIQVIAPDATLPTGTPGAVSDPALDESGDFPLTPGVGVVTIPFLTVKAGEYRFEYLYIAALGSAAPEIIPIVAVSQTIYGFTVDLGAYPLEPGYVLHWHVVVTSIIQTPGTLIDAPESLRLQLPQTPTFLVTFANPRSNTTYGFSELRVENLIDPPNLQTPILPQVVAKTTSTFTVALSPTPDTNNYFLVVRTP